MKRVEGACVELTQAFETREEFDRYVARMDKRHEKYRILEETSSPKYDVVVKMIKGYGTYSIGDYLKNEAEAKA